VRLASARFLFTVFHTKLVAIDDNFTALKSLPLPVGRTGSSPAAVFYWLTFLWR
jgi:hypothetical protein